MVNAEKLENTLSESVMMGLVDSVLKVQHWLQADMLVGVQDSSEHLTPSCFGTVMCLRN